MGAPSALSVFWNRRYEAPEYVYGTEPNDFLVRFSALLAPASDVLCLADGEGRNSVWLARRGHRVTAVDVAGSGLRKARQLARQAGVVVTTLEADVTTFDLGSARWDAIASIFLHLPARARGDLHRRCVLALKPGGLYLFEAYGPQQLEFKTGGPPEAALLPALQDVLAELDGCEIVHRFAGVRLVHEGRLHHGDGYVVQLVARRPR